MYKLGNKVSFDRDDICSECYRYEDGECIHCLHLKNITEELGARIGIYSCDNYMGPEDDEEIDF